MFILCARICVIVCSCAARACKLEHKPLHTEQTWAVRMKLLGLVPVQFLIENELRRALSIGNATLEDAHVPPEVCMIYHVDDKDR